MSADLAALAAAFDDLRKQVDWLLDQADAGAAAASPALTWSALTAEQAEGAWAQLCGWVDWLTDRYGLEETLPGCWYRHGPLVEELAALRAAWLGAYTDPAATAREPADWHEVLDRTLERIRRWDRAACATGTHRDDVPLPRDDAQRADRAAFIRADIAARDPGGPPAQSPLRPRP